jgi:hypothetical protein
VLEHLTQGSRPFRHAGCHKSFEFFLGRPATSPGARLGCQRARVFRNQIPASSIRRRSSSWEQQMRATKGGGAYSFSIFTRTNQQ